MNTALQLIVVAALSGVPVEVTTLDGQSQEGELHSLSSEQVIVQSSSEELTFPVDSLMRLQLAGTVSENKSPEKVAALTDSSKLGFDVLTLTEKNALLKSSTLPELSIQASRLSTIRWGNVDELIAESWQDLQSRKTRDDLLVFRKGDVLDYVAGTVTEITDKAVTLSVQGRNLPAPLERVFGVVFGNRVVDDSPGTGMVKTVDGDELKAQSLELREQTLQIGLSTNSTVSLDLSRIIEIDFGGGRIRYLAELPYDESASVSPDEDFPVVWFTAKNFPAGTGGRRPLLIDKKSYQRGLWMHSGAVVRFRLNRQFAEFRTVAGFDQTHINNMPRFDPKVKLIIEGDGEELYAREFLWSDAAEEIKLSLANVRELIIRVESLGDARGILEHFALGDAQVIK